MEKMDWERHKSMTEDFDEVQYALLLKGRKEWNKWREENPEEEIKLCGSNMASKDLTFVNLKGAYLSKVNLKGANLSGAELQGSVLAGADLEASHMNGANLSGASADGANFSHAELTNTVFEAADLQGVDFTFANLTGANLQYTDLLQAKFYNTNLEKADLRRCSDLILDNTIIRNSRFSPNSSDPWSVLRRTYTGPRLIINILFFLVFLSPYIVKTVYWYGVNKYQEFSVDIAKNSGITEEVSNLAKCFSETCIDHRAWELIFGFVDNSWPVMLTILLVIYNISKIIMTYSVSLLRDEEERSGLSPAYSTRFAENERDHFKKVKNIKPRLYPRTFHYVESSRWALFETYGWIDTAHGYIQALFIIAIITFSLNAYDWLTVIVSIPSPE